MRLLRLECTLAQLSTLDVVPHTAVRLVDADPFVALAALDPSWSGPWGVWAKVGADYPASLLARDIKTLAHLGALSLVVVEAPSDASAHAAVVRALLEGDAVSLENDVATLRGATNLPAPPRTIAVWASDGLVVWDDQTRLTLAQDGPGWTEFSS